MNKTVILLTTLAIMLSMPMVADASSVTYTTDNSPDPSVNIHLDQQYAAFGDADRDGDVDLNDFVILKSQFGNVTPAWTNADFTGDGAVTLEDFVVLKSNFGGTISPNLNVVPVPVPEPLTMLSLSIGLAAIGMGVRRRTQK